MAQDPNLPRIKIGESCRNQLEPLVQTLHELITAAHPGGGWWLISHPKMVLAINKARHNLHLAENRSVIDEKTASEIESLLGDLPPKFPETEAEVNSLAYVYNNLNTAIDKTVDALLNAAVDCECREAKVIEGKLGNEALQRILRGHSKEEMLEMIRPCIRSEGESDIPIRVVATPSPTNPAKWALFDKSTGTFFGKERDTFEEADQAADKENRRYVGKL